MYAKKTQTIEQLVHGCKPWYQRAASTAANSVHTCVQSKYTAAGAAALVTTAAYVGLAHAQGTSPQETYGFFSGMWDGMMVGPNMLLSIFSDSSWAADGDGIKSGPNTFGYWIGYIMTGGTESAFLASLTGDSDDD